MKSKLIFKLDNIVQNYAWGSKDSFSRILGLDNPDNKPMAELWMGAHPKAPSVTEKGPLNELIEKDPRGFLGSAVSARFGGRLPFLFKVLAAGTPLSIQAHPSLEQAREGFNRENGLNIDPGAFNRNYKDDNHKPEIMCALTEFSAMWGFRPPDEIKTNFEALESGAAVSLLPYLSTKNEREALMGFFKALMSLSGEKKEELIESALKYSGNHDDMQTKWVKEFARLYPGDPGILSPLYLNILKLAPGEAVYIPAGELHAYLDGTGIELMANSDNVLRGGLTPKHVDVSELMSILSFSSRNPELAGSEKQGGITTYPVPAEEFILRKIEPAGKRVEMDIKTAQILICLGGKVSCTAGREGEAVSIDFMKGESFFLSAAAGKLVLEGDAVIWAAGIPEPENQ